MSNLPDVAERIIVRRLSALEDTLRSSAYSDDEIDVLIEGIREHLLSELNEGDTPSLAEIEKRLSEIIEDFTQELPSVEAESSGHPLGLPALISAIGAIAIIVFGSVIAPSVNADGGTLMILTALLGFPIAFVLSWMSRKSHTGRAALLITSIASLLLVALLGIAYAAALFE